MNLWGVGDDEVEPSLMATHLDKAADISRLPLRRPRNGKELMDTDDAEAEDIVLIGSPGQELSASILGSGFRSYEASERLRGTMSLRITTWNGKTNLLPHATTY